MSPSELQLTGTPGLRPAEMQILVDESHVATAAMGASRLSRAVIRHLVDHSIGQFHQMAQRLQEAYQASGSVRQPLALRSFQRKVTCVWSMPRIRALLVAVRKRYRDR
jgi:hypothetical protein